MESDPSKRLDSDARLAYKEEFINLFRVATWELLEPNGELLEELGQESCL